MRINQETRDRMVDVVLEFNNTPRHHLFKYPHRDDDSRALIQAAEDVVEQVLTLYSEVPPVSVRIDSPTLRPTWLDGRGF